jgi:hypothetical protein
MSGAVPIHAPKTTTPIERVSPCPRLALEAKTVFIDTAGGEVGGIQPLMGQVRPGGPGVIRVGQRGCLSP